MVFPETVEQLKTEYTDKYVKVDASRPELARFAGAVGQVKTVNMNGRALVQFLDYHLNIGWFDIDLSCLTVVEKPAEDLTAKPEPKRAHDKPAGKAAPTTGDKQVADAAGVGTTRLASGEKKLSPLELARMQGAGGKGAAPAKPAGDAGAPAKKSTADILAAARGGAAAAPATPAAKPASGGKMTTADILAAARGKASTPAAETPAAPAAPTPPAPPKAEAASTPPAAAEPAAPASAGGVVKVDKSGMTVEQMIDYCRAKDAQ